jgi:hypothetical protein
LSKNSIQINLAPAAKKFQKGGALGLNQAKNQA